MQVDLPHVLQDVATGVIAGLVLAVAGWTRGAYVAASGRRDPRYHIYSLYGLVAIWLLCNAVGFSVIVVLGLGRLADGVLFASTSIPLLLFFWREVDQFWRVGLIGADEEIGRGIDYRRALQLTTHEFAFLGTGASKLTEYREEFEEALHRCTQRQPIRFLLMQPTDDNLTQAAKRADRPEQAYRRRVLRSLRTISELKRARGFPIEVRFYPEAPKSVFRLMFIGNSLCLMSYNVFGEGDGSQLPQLHLVRAPESRPIGSSFYHALELYFEELWGVSTPWDFVSHLDAIDA